MTDTEQKKNVEVVTPWGFISYPSIAEPNTRGEFDIGIHKCSLYIPVDEFKTDIGKGLLQAVLDCGRKAYGKPDLKLTEFENPFLPRNNTSNYIPARKIKTPEWVREGHYHITAKNHNGAPIVLGPDKTEWTPAQAKKIKGGDIGRFVVQVYFYTTGKSGVALSLQIVQFKQAGKPFGADPRGGITKLDAVEIKAEDLNVGTPLITATADALALG